MAKEECSPIEMGTIHSIASFEAAKETPSVPTTLCPRLSTCSFNDLRSSCRRWLWGFGCLRRWASCERVTVAIDVMDEAESYATLGFDSTSWLLPSRLYFFAFWPNGVNYLAYCQLPSRTQRLDSQCPDATKPICYFSCWLDCYCSTVDGVIGLCLWCWIRVFGAAFCGFDFRWTRVGLACLGEKFEYRLL